MNITPSPEENQFQPASLDVRFGLVEIIDGKIINENLQRYDNYIQNNGKHIKFPSDSDLESSEKLAEFLENNPEYLEFIDSIDNFVDNLPRNIRPFEEDGSFILESGQQAYIYSLEQFFDIPDWLSMFLELRSSNGRRGLSSADDLVQNLSYEGRVKMSVINKNPNPLRFHEGDRFAQLFFEVDDNVSYIPNTFLGRAYSSVHKKVPLKYKHSFKNLGINTGIVRNVHNSQIMNENGINYLIDKGLLEVSPGAVIENDHLVFTCSDTARSFKKNFGIVDTHEDYDDKDLYDMIDLSKPYRILKDDLLVVKLEEQLKLSSHVGILLKFSHPSNDNNLFNHKVGAGWVDPGYEGQVTIHDWTWFMNILKKGNVVMSGYVYYFPESVGNSYGSPELGSHYISNNITASV